MAPIKFEEAIKEKLEKRRLEPSERSWESLSQRLDKEKGNIKPKGYWWLGIAASIVVMVSIILFDNTSETDSNLPSIVESVKNSNDDELYEDEVIIDGVNSVETEGSTKSDIVLNTEEFKGKVQIQTNKNETILIKDQRDQSQALANNSKIDEKLAKVGEQFNPVDNSDSNTFSKADLNGNDLEEAISEVKKLQLSQTKVSESEIDSLLKWAQNELFKDKIDDSKIYSVDADKLLIEVESDIEQSFRGRVFETLKNSYITIKTSVAERNN